MKSLRKIMALLIAMIMVVGMSVAVFAAAGDTISATKGTITVQNAAMGETYKIFKIFDATISKVEGNNGAADSVAYKYSGTLPAKLATVFEKIGNTDYVQRKSGKTDEQVLAAVNEYVATLADSAAAGSTTASGTSVVFNNLDFGYYAVKSTQGTTVTIDSANPNAVIFDKNTTTPTADKKVEEESYSIGDTVKYTATFDTANWLVPDDATGDGTDAKQVTSYVISDTLPEFLSNVTITSVKIIVTPAQAAVEDDPSTPDVDESKPAVEEVIAENGDLSSQYTAFTNKQIVIPWATEVQGSNPKTYKSLYPNGAIIEIKYQGKLTSVTNINADDTNTVKIQPKVWNPEENKEEPWDDSWEKDETIQTYAAALKKTDGTNALDGAKFQFYGLTVDKTADGVYTVVGYDATAYKTELGEGETQDPSKLGTEMQVDANGKLYIVGLKAGLTLHGIESAAPNGYNKLTGEVTLTPQVMTSAIYKQSGTINYDAKGNVVSQSSTSTTTKTVEKNLADLDPEAVEVINNKGNELPATGGIGTTIFYIVGGILVAGAAIILIAKRRTRV